MLQSGRRILSYALLQRLTLLAFLALLLAGCGSSPSPTPRIAHRCADYVSSEMTDCRSPDGSWSVRYTGDSARFPLEVRHRGSRTWTRVEYWEPDSCCENVTWAKPHTLLFADNYRLVRVDPGRYGEEIANWENFVVSPNGRWIAGWDDAAPHMPETVSIISVDGRDCMTVPRSSDQSDEAAGFTQDSKNVIVSRVGYSTKYETTTGSAHLIEYSMIPSRCG